MTTIKCFVLEPTGTVQRYLRRYVTLDSANATCRASGYHHDAMVPLDQVAADNDSDGFIEAGTDDISHDHSDWPTACVCGYVFQDSDTWQVFIDRLFRRADSGELITLRDAPPGAMWFAPWFERWYRGPDGRCLVVRTPGGDWIVDAPPSDAPADRNSGWDRIGSPPMVTANPSIHIVGEYHGWLRNGELVDA